MPTFRLYFESMAGTHLADAIRALRDAGSADALYDPALRATDPADIAYEDYAVATDVAEDRRVTYSRRSLLFAAFAAEAYANDFLYEQCAGQDFDALQWLSTVDKYAVLPRFAGAAAGLDRGSDPLQTLRWLFQRRDELVHAKPKGRDLTYDPDNHNPLRAAKCVVAVAQAAAALSGQAPEGSLLRYVLAERKALVSYGQRASAGVPGIHDASSPIDLLHEVRRRDWSDQLG